MSDAVPLARPVHTGPDAVTTPRPVRPAAAIGPAFVVAVAYIDPGNFATNMAGGARYGYLLLWVVAVANLLAMFVQYLSAKLGIATGRSLPELCRQRCPRSVTWLLWAQAEVVAMATDLAEFVGAALALHLLFGLPVLAAGVATAAVTCALLMVAPAGRQRFAVLIGGLLALVVAGFVWQALRAGIGAGAVTGLVPHVTDRDSLLLATGILGATVMPHAVYLHSGLTTSGRPRTVERLRATLRTARMDIAVALGVAGGANLAMLGVAAAVLHGHDASVDTLQGIRNGLATGLGHGMGVVFGLSLLVAGLASSCVGTCSGELIMQGFLRARVPALARRLVTVAPALVLLAVGVEPTNALVLSQVVLSFGLPFALVPLALLTADRGVMGALVNRRVTTVAAVAAITVVCALNGLLVLWG